MEMTRIKATKWIVLATIVAALSAGSRAGSAAASDPAQWTDTQQEEFLRTAAVRQRKTLSVGITRSQRLTLNDGEITHDAHMQTINESKARFEGTRGTEVNFRDFYLFNVAAYRLDRLIGLNVVPVSVERKVAGTRAALTWWVDDVQMMESDRHKKRLEPPDQADWNDQMYNVRVLNQLVYNTDPNLGNLLITKDWKLHAIDFTRAFRRHKDLPNPENLVRIDRRVYEGLRSLTREKLQAELGDVLNKPEIEGLVARRDKILEVFDQKIARAGEAGVICDQPGH
jgi:hypothetical protein